jgi:predicted DsbA family dithiol-disulfide isomerase
LERRYGATVDWRPFDLHPEYPAEGIPRGELLARYGGDAVDHMRGLIEGAGFVYDPPDRVPNSNRALRLTELARDRGLHDVLHHRLLTGYWSRRRDIGDPEVLVEEAEAVGIPEPDTRAALDSEELAARVDASTRTALRNGVTGVPAWAIDSRLILPGAQPHEVFDSLLRRLGHSPLEAVGESS